MKHQRDKKKPLPGRTEGGISENQSGRNVFSIQDNTTSPQEFQSPFTRIADTYRLKSEFWRTMADASDILAILSMAQHRGRP